MSDEPGTALLDGTLSNGKQGFDFLFGGSVLLNLKFLD